MTNFCVHSLAGVSVVDSRGALRPCCKYDNRDSIPTIFDVDTLNGLHRIKPYADIKNNLNKGNWPRGCHRCQLSEQSNIQSRRQWTNKFYGDHGLILEPGKIQDLEIALDYTCNMRCQICNPGASSKWSTDKSLLNELDTLGVKLDGHTDYRNYQDRMQYVLSNTDLSAARHVKIEGGEPFYAKHLSWFINKLRHEVLQPHLLFLNITTNGSVYPEKKVIRQLQYFRNSCISFSLDGTEKLAEATRWGAKWETIDENIKKFTQTGINLQASCTVSILNWNQLAPLIRYLKRRNITLNFSELTDPKHLSIYQLPLSVRKQFVTGNTSLDNILTADITIDNQLSKTRDYINIIDRYQKTDFSSVNKQAWEIINANIR